MKPNHTAIFVDRSIFEENTYKNMVKETGNRKSTRGNSTPSSIKESEDRGTHIKTPEQKTPSNKTPLRMKVLPTTSSGAIPKVTLRQQGGGTIGTKINVDEYTVPTNELMDSEGFFKAVDSGPDLVYSVGADERSWNPESILPPEPTNPLLKTLADIKNSDSYRRVANRNLFDDVTSKSSGSGQDDGNDETDTSVQLPSPHPEADGNSQLSHAASLEPYESSQLDSDTESSDDDANILEEQNRLQRLNRQYDLYEIGPISDETKHELQKMMANLSLDIQLKTDTLILDFQVTNNQIGFQLRIEEAENVSVQSSAESNLGNKTITNETNGNIGTGTIKRSPKHSLAPSVEPNYAPSAPRTLVKTPEPEIDSIRRFSIPSLLDRSSKVYKVSYLQYKAIFDSDKSEVEQFIEILKLEGLYKPYRLTYDLSKVKPLH